MMAKSYRDLDIWKNGIEIVGGVYNVTKKFPKDETFGLAVQMRRSAVSIPSNIAEGFARQYNKEYKQFLYVALGSCSELETQIIVGAEQCYYSKESKDKLLEQLDHESRMLMNMIKAVSGSLK
jgi:four helix bundle protein